MSQCYPETEESVDSAEGTATHEIGAEIIQRGATGRGSDSTTWVGETAPNGVVWTEEMFDAAKMYADDVVSVMRERDIFGGPDFGIEQQIDIKRVHDLQFGTPDFYLFDRSKGDLFIWDFKYGHGVVEAFENWQAINYLAGLIDLLGINGEQDQHITVHIRIVQPRAHHRDGPIREWTTIASNLRGHINTLNANAHKAMSADAEICTGDHCKNCTARHACPAALKAGMNFLEVTQQPLPVELTPEALGVQLAIVTRGRKQLEYLESAYKEQVKGLIRGGKLVPGWMTENSFGREKWIQPVEEVVAMGDMLGTDLRKPQEAVTPNQARKLGVDASVITAYSSTPRTGLTLVPDNGNKAKQVFSQ